MSKRVLLVDDEPDILVTVKKLLWMNGYEVETALDGAEALEKIGTYTPDILVLDIMMPNVNGYQVCHHVRAKPETSDMPIIILSAKAQPYDKYWGEKIGANDYLTKPFDNKELVNKIADLLSSPGPESD